MCPSPKPRPTRAAPAGREDDRDPQSSGLCTDPLDSRLIGEGGHVRLPPEWKTEEAELLNYAAWRM